MTSSAIWIKPWPKPRPDIRLRCLTTLGILLAMAGGAGAADWPRLGGPDGSGVSPETGLSRIWPATGPRALWSLKVGEGFAGAAIRNSEVFLLDRLDDKQDVLRCLDLATGRELWNLNWDAPGKLPHNGSRNVPTVDEQYIFAVGPFGQFYCVDRKTRRLAWARHLVDDFKDPQIDRATAPTNRADELVRTQVPTWGMTQAPLIYRDTVIVAPQTQKVGAVAYEKATGKLRWQSSYIGRNWYSHVSPYLTRLDGVEQIIMLAQPSDPEKYPPAIVSSLDPDTGRILWTTKTPGPHKIPIPQPLRIGDDRLFITGGYGLGCVMLQVIRTNGQWETKLIKHNKEVAGHIHAPVLYRDHIYLSSLKEQQAEYAGLVCLDDNGRVLWQTWPNLRFDNGGLLIADGLALVMHGKTGELHMLEVSPAGYQLLAKAKVLNGRNPWAPMALSDGKLLVRDLEQIKCLELKK